ncbi:MAG: TRAP transporter fused permease subunit, partial [Acidobacteriota bacterium]
MRFDSVRRSAVRPLSVLLCLFVLVEVNLPQLEPLSQLAVFAGLGLALAFLVRPARQSWEGRAWSDGLDLGLALASLCVFAYVVIMTEPAFAGWWPGDRSLGERAGIETGLDIAVGVVGLLLVLEASRRTVGLALPILALLFVLYARVGPSLPDALFPHAGYGWERIVTQTFLQVQGVFGTALKVMFSYVFLFVVFGVFLELTGATAFILQAARRLLGSTPGGPAKVAILSSGLMGSLSGSAVANTATTGTFTIPLMRSGGFRPTTAAGIESAASSGGALVPPVMGAGAYMMLEIVAPPVTYLEIVRAAIVPAVLYYLSLFLIAHFRAQRLVALGRREVPSAPVAADGTPDADTSAERIPTEETVEAQASEPSPASLESAVPPRLAGATFVLGLATLVGFLLANYTVFRSATLALGVVAALGALHPASRPTLRRSAAAFERAARAGMPLVAASACVGIVLGIVTLTGVGQKLPTTLLPLAESNLLLALLLLMVSSIVLGMGLPSAVCYLLLATLVGPALGDLGVVPLAAHFFIFYFGLMSMVTPPVALAAYTAASIAGSPIMKTAFAAFRFSLIGFVLPF